MVESYNLILVASLITLLFLVPRLWTLRHAAGAIELLLCSLACGLWSLGYLFEILFPALPLKIFWAKFEYLGIATVTVWVLLFVIRYTGLATRLNSKHMLALLFIPALTIVFVATNEAHAWVWTSIALQPEWTLAPLALGHGWWFWVNIGYSYILLLGGTILFVQFIFRTQKLYLAQSLIMLAAMFIPWLGNALYILGVRPGPNLDLTPLAFTLTNIGLVIAFVRYRLLELLPVAYSSIFKFMSDGVIVLDAKDRIVDVNPAARRIFQPSGSDIKTMPRQPAPAAHDLLIGHSIAELLPAPGKRLNAVFRPSEMEVRLTQGAAQRDRVYTLAATSIQNRDQPVTGQVLIFSDITELKNAEEQMRLQVTALETAENGIVITDRQGQIEWANPAFTRLTGYTLEEVKGQNPRILKSGKHGAELYSDLWKTIVSGKVWQGDLINRRKDGTFYDEEMTITPLIQPDGTIAHFIAIKQDVTIRVQAEEQLKLAHEQALESNRFKTQLLANVSHDMRTPLSGVTGYAEMLCAGVFGEMNAEQLTAVTEIQDSANQLLIFINNLIGQAQFETGKIRIKPRFFSAQDLVETWQSTIKLPAEKKGLSTEVEIDPALPLLLTGDLYWLRQILVNLSNNAVKFTDHGTIQLRLYMPDPSHWNMEVIDTGIGISTEMQAIVFDPFVQVDGSTTRERVGSGLGLAFVKELTSLMGGEISLSSRPAAGSTFTISFPLTSEEKN